MIKEINKESENALKKKKKNDKDISLTSIAEKNDIIDDIELHVSKLCPEEGISIDINVD